MSGWERAFPAPAKLNLFLHVVGRRADGYHLLQSAMRLVDHGDVLRFSPRSDGLVRRSNDVTGVPEDDDLAIRAARLLKRAAGVSAGVTIELDKRLPLGGGLGGGSSDAATTLMALNKLWRVGWPPARLQALALELGADIPFFVFGESAFVEGIGEQLRPLRLPPAWYLVVEPPASMSTAAVFADPRLTRHAKPIKMADFSAGYGRNDLQAVVCERCPPVAEAISWLGRWGDARMTGSGSCVFAEFTAEGAARDALAQLPSGWKGWVAASLDRHPLREWAQSESLGSRQVG